jgi:hypothetical protein
VGGDGPVGGFGQRGRADVEVEGLAVRHEELDEVEGVRQAEDPHAGKEAPEGSFMRAGVFTDVVWCPWTNVMILKIFPPKNLAKILAFLLNLLLPSFCCKTQSSTIGNMFST